MKLVVTVVGVDRVGIIAGVSTVLADHGVNIMSINQTILDQFNLPIVLWSADSRDWEVQDVERIKANVLSEIEDGGIIIMHDGYETSVQATDELLALLTAQNYRVVSVSELFALKHQSMPLHEKIKTCK